MTESMEELDGKKGILQIKKKTPEYEKWFEVSLGGDVFRAGPQCMDENTRYVTGDARGGGGTRQCSMLY